MTTCGAVRANRTPAKTRLASALFIAYVVVTGIGFLLLRSDPGLGAAPGIAAFADAVGAVFSVVGNAANCSSFIAARRALIALLVVCLHALMLPALVAPAWSERKMKDGEPARLPRPRAWIEIVGGSGLVALLYWFTFFKLGTRSPGQVPAASYICWDLGALWLLLTMQGTLAVVLAAALATAIRSAVVRAARSIAEGLRRG